MSGLDPKGPSQPTLSQAYETEGNPADQNSAEKASAETQAQENSGEAVEHRVPEKQSTSIDDATPSSLGQGIHGAPAGEEAQGKTDEDVGRHQELEGEQMRAPGEGEVADVVDKKPGASGAEQDLASDLDRKKAEQAEDREAVKEERRQKVDVGAILSQRKSAPANPVGKDNYPNSDKY